MSGLKSIELQVALPRTQTAGKLQDQMQQRSTVTQDQLIQKQLEEATRNKNIITETETTEKKRLKNDNEGNKGQNREQSKNRRGKNEENLSEELKPHPYKGKHFDVKW